MANTLGNNIVVHIFTTSGSIDASGDLNSSNLKWDRNNPETTTYGKSTVQRIAGLRDYSLDFAGLFNSGPSAMFSQLIADMNASLYTLIKWLPAGSVTGCPILSGSMLLSSFNMSGPVGGPVAISWTAQAGAGSLTAASAV